MSSNLNKIKIRKTKNDIFYTPLPVALKMIEMCNIQEGDKVLDPCRGGGIFYNNLPNTCIKSFCEKTEDIDFFKDNNFYDVIIGNPPYSMWSDWIKHTVTITNKFCYIFGAFNLTTHRMNEIKKYNFTITAFHIIQIDWWMGLSFLIVFEKNKPSLITVEDKVILCDICNTRCRRGRSGNSPNICTFIKTIL